VVFYKKRENKKKKITNIVYVKYLGSKKVQKKSVKYSYTKKNHINKQKKRVSFYHKRIFCSKKKLLD
jgi:hypothetical protein